MSVSLFVMCFKDGKLDHLPKALAEQAFGPFIIVREPNFWRVAYDICNESDIYFEEGEAGLTDFMIDRPCADIRLYESIFQVLQGSNSAMFWPDDCPPSIARSSVARHLPADVVESMGTPRVVGSAVELASV